jgi:hypothetical protein
VDLASLILILLIIVAAIQFWRLRTISEFMIDYANQYCNKHNLQYISLARTKSRFTGYKGKLDWQLCYELAFSSDGETEYKGNITCHGKYIIRLDMPVYRVVENNF